jgi:hypothetical protein
MDLLDRNSLPAIKPKIGFGCRELAKMPVSGALAWAAIGVMLLGKRGAVRINQWGEAKMKPPASAA